MGMFKIRIVENGVFMSLKLMYITNRPYVAKIAQDCGVKRIFVDLEYIGKAERQPGDTVKSYHNVEDVVAIRSVITDAELMVRVNPIHSEDVDGLGSKREIDQVISAGADMVMLPMAKSVEEVERFVDLVDGRAKTMFLLETAEANENAEAMLNVAGIDAVHIGLNDLHLSYKMKFMFEPLVDGKVDRLCSLMASYGYEYGVGGIARIGYGMLPAEYIIAEHYRLGSSCAILSRSFCNIVNISDDGEISELFKKGIGDIRDYESRVAQFTSEEFEYNKRQTKIIVKKICDGIGG